MEYKKISENLIDKEILQKYSKKFNLNEKIIEILFNRGINSEDKIDKFLNENINNLKDPFLLINMKEAANRISKAIENNEKILIFGDYDVDGICATAILYNYLITKTNNVATYLPNRYEDGYGLTCPCLDRIAEKEHPNLIITVDCGITCVEEIEYIKKMGIDVIVTDHHELPEILPKCLIVTTKFDQAFNFKGLCGAGVSFKLVQALSILNSENYEKYLPLAAIATIADIVPLVDENRIIVKEGLKRLDLLPVGVKFLLKNHLNKLNSVSSTDIGFKIAPLINSAGRLDDANIALNLFIKTDLKLINNSLKNLEELNNKRKAICKNIYDECVQMLSFEDKNNKSIVLYNNNWEIGLLGIVAARICEDYNKPTILLGKNNGEFKGSCRTNNNINIFNLLSSVSGLLNKFGGHAKAGGLSLKEENLTSFKKAVEDYVNNYVEEEIVNTYDLELTEADLTIDFVKELSVLEPFGYENTNPVFKVVFNTLKITLMKNYPENLIIYPNKNLELISFNDYKNYENYNNFNKKEMLVELSLNVFRNLISIKGLVKDVKFYEEKPLLQTKLNANLLNQFNTNEVNEDIKTYTSLKQILNLNSKKTLFISYNINNKSILEIKNINVTSFYINKKNSQNTLLFGIESLNGFENFTKIVFLDYVNLNFAKSLKKFTKAEIYIPFNKNEFKLNFSREELLNVYYSFIKVINKNLSFNSLYSFYEYMLANYKISFNYQTFYLGVLVFKELKLIEEKIVNNLISYKLNKIKVNLEDSIIIKNLKGEIND